MKTFNYNITNKHIDECMSNDDYNYIKKYNEILIQVFSGDTYDVTQKKLCDIKLKFPNAKILTTSTDGEIIGNIVTTKNIIVTISVFEKTKLNTAMQNKSDYNSGVEIAKKLINEKTKLLILFIDGIDTNGENILDGIYSVSSDIIIAGGLSGDNGNFVQCFMGIGDELYTKGIVGVAFDSDDLIVQNLYSFGWDTIGIGHIITKSKNNRVYEIDNMKALDFYKKYLGEESLSKLPSIGMQFPLIYKQDGMPIARAMIINHNDGSLSFAGNLDEGIKIYFGVGDTNKIMTNHINNLTSISHESFFIYSCMARRRLIPNDVYKELTQFIELAPTSGFFTYGEIFTSKKYELLNHTLTAISLSENTNSSIDNNKKFQERRNVDSGNDTTQILTNILNQTYKDLEGKNQELNKSVDHFTVLFDTALEGIIISDMNQNIVDINKAALEMFNYESKEVVVGKETLTSHIPKDQLPKVVEGLKKDRVDPFETYLLTEDGKIINVVAGGKTVVKNGQKLRITTVMDISQLKLKDRQLIQQSYLAQMGEMINMIAHQWRQPLNTINIISAKIKMKNELGILSSEAIIENMNAIENITQNMSQTINDFMNLTNPNMSKEKIVFRKLFEEVEGILGAQFKAHEIDLRLIDKSKISIMIQKNDLMHIIINILTNARDAFDEITQDKKQIIIEVFSQNKDIYIYIKDNAGGIKQDNIDRIFEPYFTTKEQGKGTGLGLYMSKKILNEILVGDISVENSENGAIFKIILKSKKED